MPQEFEQPIHIVRVEREEGRPVTDEQPQALVFRNPEPHEDHEAPDMNEIW